MTGLHRHGHAVSGGPAAGSDLRRLAVALGLIVTFMVGEVVVAAVVSSLALLADAGHMLTDAGALAASIWAIRLTRRPARGKWTFGFARAEILSAAANGVTLLVVAALVGFEAIRRLVHPTAAGGAAMLATALVGVAVNVAATWVLAGAHRGNLNIAGAFAHIVTDLYAFIGTAVAGIVIITTGFDRADPIASLVVVALMLRASWGLLRASGRVLLEAAPDAVDMAAVRAHLMHAAHVVDVHDLHAWTVGSDLPTLSTHVVIEDGCFADGHAPQILDELQSCLNGHFDVAHSTFQLEPTGHADHEPPPHP